MEVKPEPANGTPAPKQPENQIQNQQKGGPSGKFSPGGNPNMKKNINKFQNRGKNPQQGMSGGRGPMRNEVIVNFPNLEK